MARPASAFFLRGRVGGEGPAPRASAGLPSADEPQDQAQTGYAGQDRNGCKRKGDAICHGLRTHNTPNHVPACIGFAGSEIALNSNCLFAAFCRWIFLSEATLPRPAR